ncbi:glycoside hydrolase family 9 protein [Mycena metata]|uniref:Endoglucanase n=1 Tax=Mycena metata TaxID=1033252 RepID=A0AAD7NYQ4_9AGAR|nr:glycoside hydrolase family 9 protein [Mycena metata]
MWPPFLLQLLLPVLAAAQLPLPNPPYLPPSASSGAQTSSSSGNTESPVVKLARKPIYFYDAQRSGTLPANNRVPWRNSSLVNDGKDAGIGSERASIPPCFFNLFTKCPAADLDDAYWGGDQNIPQNPLPPHLQPAQLSIPAGPSTDLTLILPHCKTQLTAQTLQTHAQQLYTFAKTYQSSVPAVGESYGSSGFGDDLTIAALFLAWASGTSSYYQDAQHYFQQYKLTGQDDVFNWDSKTPGIYVLLAQIAQGSSGLGGNLTTWQTECERYFDNIVNNNAASLTSDGLLYYDGDSNDATLNPALNAAMLLTRYAPMASTSDKKASYTVRVYFFLRTRLASEISFLLSQKFAQNQLDYVLGKNSMSGIPIQDCSAFLTKRACLVPYVVGSNPNSPANPHSAMASGGNDIGNIDTSPPQEAYVLYGAVVGGPDKHGRFYDIRSDWPETEVALDYNAPMLTLAAMHVLNDTSDPFFTSLQAGAYDKVRPSGQPCDDAISDGCSGPKLSKAAIIALAVVLSVVGLIIIGLLIWYFRIRRARK